MKEKKLYLIDDVGPELDWERTITWRGGYSWTVWLSETEVNAIVAQQLDPNQDNDRRVNLGILLALSGYWQDEKVAARQQTLKAATAEQLAAIR